MKDIGKMLMGKLNRLVGRQLRIKRESRLPKYKDGNSAWQNINDNWAIYIKDKRQKIATGYLWRARHRKTGQIGFVKQTDYARVLDNKKLEPYFGCWNDLRYSAIRECKLLDALAHDGEHPHIIKYFDYAVDDEKKQVFLVMEYPENCMSLNYYLHIHMREILKSEDGPKKERFAKELLRQITSAIGYCHEHFIVHRDLKLENVIVCPSVPRPYETDGTDKKTLTPKDIIYKSPFDDDWTAPHLKLIDFGLSTVFYHDGKDGWLDGRVGTQTYFAPEVVEDLPHPGYTHDNWALGVLGYILATGYHPFTYGPRDFRSYTVAVQRDIVAARYFRPKWMSAEFKHFLRRTMRRNWKGRANIIEIANHPWLNCSTKPCSYFNHPYPVKYWWMPPKYHLVKELYEPINFCVPQERRDKVIDVNKMDRAVLDEVSQGYYGWIYSYGFEELSVDDLMLPSLRRVNGRSCKQTFYLPEVALYLLVEKIYKEKGLLESQRIARHQILPELPHTKTAAQQIVEEAGEMPEDDGPGSRRSSNTMVDTAEADEEERRRSVDTVESDNQGAILDKDLPKVPEFPAEETDRLVPAFYSLVSGF